MDQRTPKNILFNFENGSSFHHHAGLTGRCSFSSSCALRRRSSCRGLRGCRHNCSLHRSLPYGSETTVHQQQTGSQSSQGVREGGVVRGHHVGLERWPRNELRVRHRHGGRPACGCCAAGRGSRTSRLDLSVIIASRR